MYIRSEDTFKHFDSLQSSNLPAAEQCAAKLAPLVKCKELVQSGHKWLH